MPYILPTPKPELVVSAALDAALEAAKKAHTASGARTCARCYVGFVGLDRAARQRLKNWAAFRGMRFFGRDGRVPDSLYFGYDNATGIERGRAEAFALALDARGVCAYTEEQED